MNIDELRLEFKIVEAARAWLRFDRARNYSASDQAKRELIAAVDALESTRRRRPKATTLESRRGLPRNVRGYDGGFHDLICAQSGWPGRPVPPCDCEEEPR